MTFYNDVNDIPWFKEVVQQSREHLEWLMIMNPDAVPDWYKKQREANDTRPSTPGAEAGS